MFLGLFGKFMFDVFDHRILGFLPDFLVFRVEFSIPFLNNWLFWPLTKRYATYLIQANWQFLLSLIKWNLLGVKLKKLRRTELYYAPWTLCLSQHPIDADLIWKIMLWGDLKDFTDTLVRTQQTKVSSTLSKREYFISNIITHEVNALIHLRIKILSITQISDSASSHQLRKVNLPMGQDSLVHLSLAHVLWHCLSAHFLDTCV